MNFPEILNFVPFEVYIVIGVLFLSLLIGIIFQRKLFPRLRKRFARSQNANLRIFVTTLQGPILIFVMLLTVYGLGVFLNIPKNTPFGEILAQSLIILQIILILFIIYILIQLSRNLIKYYTRKGKLPNTTIFTSISNLLILIIGTMLVLYSVGIDINPLIGALGIGGLAVALALQPTLANLFAGISIIASKQINPGDFVQLNADNTGFIEDIQWRTTSIRTPQNNLIIIPNSTLSNMLIINYSYPQKEMSLTIDVGVHYDSDLDHVRTICLEVANTIIATEEAAIKTFTPVVRFLQFGDSSINLRVIMRVSEFTQQYYIRSEFIRILRRRFKEEGIIIPYPIRTLEFSNNLQLGRQSDEHSDSSELL